MDIDFDKNLQLNQLKEFQIPPNHQQNHIQQIPLGAKSNSYQVQNNGRLEAESSFDNTNS